MLNVTATRLNEPMINIRRMRILVLRFYFINIIFLMAVNEPAFNRI